MRGWLALLRPGDWLLVLVALLVCVLSFPLAWRGGAAEKAVIRRGGELFAELPLSRNRRIKCPARWVQRRSPLTGSAPACSAIPACISTVCVRAGWHAPEKSPSVRRIRSACRSRAGVNPMTRSVIDVKYRER